MCDTGKNPHHHRQPSNASQWGANAGFTLNEMTKR
jgi:hypothetical protein